ncbi:DUF4132 domain-containing protein [Shewanella algae]|uniref:DUF4132 domain-containing protein n=1 Tax=Shewanella algae TaxID=38313 RepID=UPI001F185035|nr:DUF4132 domain-containing protein [Shewanella algae]MCE9782345.1 DUF4132 domain-containing protein [Shewanella algae]
MLDVLKNKLEAFTRPNTDKLLLDACRIIDEQQTGLAQAVSQYILTGEPVACLSQLQQLSAGETLARPGVSYGYGQNDERLVQARDAINRFVATGACNEAAVMRRLGLVCHACNPDISIYGVQNTSSGWLNGVLMLFKELAEEYYGCRLAGKDLPSRDYLASLVAQYEHPPHELEAFILEGSDSYYHDTFRTALRKRTDWLKLSEDPEYLQLLKQLHFSGRETFCALLNKACQTLSPAQLPLVMALAADGSATVREEALKLLKKSPQQQLLAFLEREFPGAKAATRGHWLVVAGLYPEATPLLQRWHSEEKSAAVKTALAKMLDNTTRQQQSDQFSWDIPAVAAIDKNVKVPEEWLGLCEKQLAKEIKELENDIAAAEHPDAPSYRKRHLADDRKSLQRWQQVSSAQLQAALMDLERGRQSSLPGFYSLISHADLDEHPKASLRLILRMERHELSCHSWERMLSQEHILRSLPGMTDLRQLLSLCNQENQPAAALIEALFGYEGREDDWLPAACEQLLIWPFFAENPDYIEHGLNGQVLNGTYRHDANQVLIQTLAILAEFPKLPQHWQRKVHEHAFHGRKAIQAAAQYCAERHGADITLITPELASGSKDNRVLAATWLGRLKAASAQEALSQALKKEKDMPTRVVLLEALLQTGADISQFLGKEALLAEAKAGLKKAPPKSMDWFPRESLPACRFEDGSPVEPELVFWWVVLAVKLKQPQGNPLLSHYLSLLDSESRQRLGHFILSAFIAQDTRCPSDDEALAYANAHQHQQLQIFQQWARYNWGKEYQHKTLEDAFQTCFAEKKNELLGSAIKDKGMLALIAGGDAQTLLGMIQPFMKKRYERRAQIEAMLQALANSDDPVAIQFLLSISRRYRTNSVQELARAQVSQIAARNGWTQDELADRTVQTAGLEHLTQPSPFEFGSRTLALALGDDLKLRLLNEEGKLLKSLPQPRQTDNEGDIAEVKKWFSNCKKELKQVVEQQSARLYEAMVTERHWLAADWQLYLHQHPVMYRLLQRTLWQVEIDGQWQTFRPTEDGAFIDIDDEELQLPAAASIRLVSGNLLPEAALDAWRSHLKDYKVKPLFEQLRSAEVTLTEDQEALNDQRGRMTDCYTLRGLLTKKGYQRGEAEDGGFFDHYFKRFDTLGLRVEFGFSGNCVPEENEAAAIYDIRVMERTNPRGRYARYRQLPLAEVPVNLLNAIAVDYREVGDKCVADPDWESKLPW